jgi:hypothetical protein
MAGYLIQAGDTRLLDALEVVLGALLNADRKAGLRLPAGGGEKEFNTEVTEEDSLQRHR